MRVVASVNIVISEDNDQTQQTSPPVEIVIDDSLPTGFKGGTYNIAGGAAQTQFLFAPEVTNGKYICIQVLSGDVSFRFNDPAAAPIGIKQNPATTPDPIMPYQVNPQPGVIFMGPGSTTSPLTSLYVHNNSSTLTARISIALLGEAS